MAILLKIYSLPMVGSVVGTIFNEIDMQMNLSAMNEKSG